MIFRPRREDYKHSMAAASEIKSFEELSILVNNEMGVKGLPVSIDDCGNGHEISTRYIVCVKFPEREYASAAGYLLDSPIKLLNFNYRTEKNPDRSVSYHEKKMIVEPER